ncbi:hypothetical protein VCRA213O314_1420001 [Vibrio crassostreae]|nr:hypothetical protein VCRA213O314_1420001 [Vibrio crassostreae]
MLLTRVNIVEPELATLVELVHKCAFISDLLTITVDNGEST